MNNVNIDERRIKVDFSQSVATLWAPYKKKQFQQAAKELFKEYELSKGKSFINEICNIEELCYIIGISLN